MSRLEITIPIELLAPDADEIKRVDRSHPARLCLQCFRPMEGNACFCPSCEAARYPEHRR